MAAEAHEHHGHGAAPGPWTTSRQPTGPRMRASDADRAATVTVLQDAVARGLLTPDEGSERMGAAFACRYVDELPGLTTDLPAPLPPGGPPAPGWRALGSLAAEQARASLGTVPTRSARANAALAALLLLAVLAVVVVAVAGLLDGPSGGVPGGWHGMRH
jgi:Domain of unknown function (DUF1707)